MKEAAMNVTYLLRTSFLCCSLSAFAQQQPAPATSQLRPRSASSQPADRRLVLDVVVTDKSGKTVKGLEQKDFTVLDNGHPQTVLSFQASGSGSGAAATAQHETPVQIILLVDEVNTNFGRVA